jgi:hypothetical protein
MNLNAHTTKFSPMIRFYMQQVLGANGEKVAVIHEVRPREYHPKQAPRKASQKKNAMTALQSLISLGFQLSSGKLYLDRIC